MMYNSNPEYDEMNSDEMNSDASDLDNNRRVTIDSRTTDNKERRPPYENTKTRSHLGKQYDSTNDNRERAFLKCKEMTDQLSINNYWDNIRQKFHRKFEENTTEKHNAMELSNRVEIQVNKTRQELDSFKKLIASCSELHNLVDPIVGGNKNDPMRRMNPKTGEHTDKYGKFNPYQRKRPQVPDYYDMQQANRQRVEKKCRLLTTQESLDNYWSSVEPKFSKVFSEHRAQRRKADNANQRADGTLVHTRRELGYYERLIASCAQANNLKNPVIDQYGESYGIE